MTELAFLDSRRFQRLAYSRRTGFARASLESQAERRCAVSKKHTETPSGETEEHSDREKRQSIIDPIIDDLKGKTKPELPLADEVAPPRGPLHPPQPAELDQDPGGGYNPDGTYPQT
jgi:hypothetical protein